MRPMAPGARALRALGATVDDDGRGTLPFTVHGTRTVPGGAVTLDASASSQFVSAPAARRRRASSRASPCATTASRCRAEPHIEMTVETLRDAGVVVDDARARHLAGRAVRDQRPRRAGRARPVQRRAVPRGRAGHRRPGAPCPGWPQHTTQAGDAIRDILDAMGAEVVARPRRAHRHRRAASISGIDVDLHDAGELTPVVAALAALADSPTVIRGVAHIRGHETDRLAALRTELSAPGRRGRPRPTTGCGSRRGRCTAGSSTPTPTTAWPWPPRCSACACPGWSSRTSARRPRRCPSSSQPVAARRCSRGTAVQRRAPR